jgi:hypothetical protein
MSTMMQTLSPYLAAYTYGSMTLIFYLLSQRIQNFGKITAALMLAIIVIGVFQFLSGLAGI